MTSLSRPLRALAAGAAAAALLTLAACGGSGHTSTSSSSTPTPVPTPTPTTPTPTHNAAPPPKNPLTGVGTVPRTPVIAVKIDDTAAGRPQLGIDKADIVYIEQVEGGLTRLAAIYGTHKPTVGYVRSTRASDPDLFLQYGKITEAYSGGAHDSLPRVHRSGIKSWSNDAGAAFYSRAPHPGDHGYINLTLNLAKVAKKTKTNRPKSIGWRFDPSLAGLPTGRGTDVRTRVGGTAVEFKYDAKLKKYVRYIGGVRQKAADGKPVTATNVIVQQCRIVPHPQDTDVLGNPSQFTYTVGKGNVAVFRGGKRITGTWSRPKKSAGTTLRLGNGKPLPLAPGNTWVALVHRGTKTSGG